MESHLHFGGGLAVLAATGLALAATGCGATSSTSTSAAFAGSHILNGCYSLPVSGGKVDLRPVRFYDVTATPNTICFQTLAAGSKCSAAPVRLRGVSIL